MKKRLLLFKHKTSVAFFVVFFLTLSNSYAFQRETELKAAYLFRLSLFVEWPASVFSGNKHSVNFCIAEDQYFFERFSQGVANKTINKKAIVIFQVDLKADLRKCHVLYLPGTVEDISSYLKRVEGKPILTIGETMDFFDEKGMILLFEKKNRIRFAINYPEVQKTGIKMRAQVLKLATQP